MYSQIISAKTLYALMTQQEHRTYCRGKNKEYMIDAIQNICVNKIYDDSYHFNLARQGNLCINAHPYGAIEHLCQDLLIRKLSKNIMHTYGLKTTNRNLVILQIKQLLESNIPLCIMRKDVRNFFENVSTTMILSELKKEGRITLQTIQLCEALLTETDSKGVKGVPRGLAISSAMTEFLMRKFDHTFTKIPDILLYNRYVDDIILINTNQCSISEIQDLVDDSLGVIKLQENTDKKNSLTNQDWIDGKKFEYLGYSFQYSNKSPTVCIANKKLNRIKTKITKAFKDFIKTGDEKLLFDRMQFLACISYIKNSSLRKIKVGLPANYSFVTTDESFKKIDIYYQRILHSKRGNFGKNLQKRLTETYKDKLSRISFVHCYKGQIKRRFSATRMHQLKNCWR